MLASFVLRLDPQRAGAGVLSGQIEDVVTGDTGVIRSAADVLAFCARHGARAGGHVPTQVPLPPQGES